MYFREWKLFSVNVLPNYISLLIVGSLKSVIFIVCRLFQFQPFINIACRSTQNAERIKRLLRLHVVIKPAIKIDSINSFKISSQIWRLSKVRTSWPHRWFWKFFERFHLLKVHACFVLPVTPWKLLCIKDNLILFSVSKMNTNASKTHVGALENYTKSNNVTNLLTEL